VEIRVGFVPGVVLEHEVPAQIRERCAQGGRGFRRACPRKALGDDAFAGAGIEAGEILQRLPQGLFDCAKRRTCGDFSRPECRSNGGIAAPLPRGIRKSRIGVASGGLLALAEARKRRAGHGSQAGLQQIAAGNARHTTIVATVAGSEDPASIRIEAGLVLNEAGLVLKEAGSFRTGKMSAGEFLRNPPVDVAFEHEQRHRAHREHRVVKPANVEACAEPGSGALTEAHECLASHAVRQRLCG